MRGFFQFDGPVFGFLSKMADIAILNLLFIACCLPVVTIGAAVTAMSYVTIKMKNGTEGYIWKSFFRSFKMNFRQATLIWLILLALLAVMGIDLRMTAILGGTLYKVVRPLVFVGLILWLLEFLYVFPMLARFDNTVFAMMRNALLAGFANAPKALLTVLIAVGMVFVTFWNQYTFVYGLLYWLLFGFGVLSLINSYMQAGVFRRLSPELAEMEEEESHE